MRIVVASTVRTFIESVVEQHFGTNQVLVVRSKEDLQETLGNSSQAIDLVVCGLVLDRTMPIRHKAELYVQQDGLRFVRETLGSRPGTVFVMCSAQWHVRLVTKAYEAGARWFIRDHALLDHLVIEGLKRVVAGQRLGPFGLDVSMRNQWLAHYDRQLAKYSARDIEVLEGWLVDCEYTAELVERLAMASLPVAYTTIFALAKKGGFKSKEALTEHALSIGLQPVDRLLTSPTPLTAYKLELFHEPFEGASADD